MSSSTSSRGASSGRECASSKRRKTTGPSFPSPDSPAESGSCRSAGSALGSATTSPALLSLPDDILLSILSLSAPRRLPSWYDSDENGEDVVQGWHDMYLWEWAGRVGRTCRALRRLATEQLAPRALRLDFFARYRCLDDGPRRSVPVIDARAAILRGLLGCRWMGERLTELHVNWSSILDDEFKVGGVSVDNTILGALRCLLTTSGSLSNLEWLDVSVGSDSILEYPLVDSSFLEAMPDALPSLQRICLAGCFKDSRDEVSGEQFRQFLESLHSPLTSLSLKEVHWMSDSHISAALPIVGSSLTRLELFGCKVWQYHEYSEGSDDWKRCIERGTTKVPIDLALEYKD